MKRAAIAVAALALAAVGPRAGLAEQWDMPVAYPATNYHTQNTQRFAAAVKELTGGRIDIVVHPNGSLIRGNDIKRAVRTRQAQIGERLLSTHSNENELYSVSELPFFAMSFDEAWKLYQASKGPLSELLAKEKLKLLYAVAWPPQGLISAVPVNDIADLKGVKMRTSSPMTTQIIEKIGASAVQIEAAELNQAYATGTVKAHLTSAASPWDSKLYEHAKYYYDFASWLPLNYTFINVDVWNGLDAESQAKILGAAAMAERAGWAEAERLSRWYPEALASKGMTVAPPADKLVTQLQKIGQEILEGWLKKTGEPGGAIIAAYRGRK